MIILAIGIFAIIMFLQPIIMRINFRGKGLNSWKRLIKRAIVGFTLTTLLSTAILFLQTDIRRRFTHNSGGSKAQNRHPSSWTDSLRADFPYDRQVSRLDKLDVKGEQRIAAQPFMPGSPAVDNKYFYEYRRNAHLDRRFVTAKSPLDRDNHEKRIPIMIELIDQFFQFLHSHNATAWLAHGTLIGWYWNQRILPWDDDIDVQMTFRQLQLLNALNQTRHGGGNDGGNGTGTDRYLLDINPHSIYRWPQRMNTIDARFIDTETGMFIDITALSDMPGAGQRVACKSPHYYQATDIFPLHPTTINGRQGTIVWRPHRVLEVLASEYGRRALTKREFAGYRWDDGKRLWVMDPVLMAEEKRRIERKKQRSKATAKKSIGNK